MDRYKEFKCIHSTHPKISNIAGKITRGLKTNDQRAKAIFEWMNKNISYGQLKLFKHPYTRTDLEVLEDKEGICGELTILFCSLAMASGLETRWARLGKDRYGVENTGHVCPVYKGDDGKWYCVDLTPYYAPFGFKIDHKDFTTFSIEELENQFKLWTKWLMQDALFIGLPLAQLINTGPIYEKIIERKKGRTRLVYVSLIPEHGDKGGEECDASLIHLTSRLYEVSKSEYKAYDKTPLELKIDYNVSPSRVTAKIFFYERDEALGKQNLIFSTDSLKAIPKDIFSKYAEILKIMNEVKPFIRRVLLEARQINAKQPKGKKIFNEQNIIEKVIKARIVNKI